MTLVKNITVPKEVFTVEDFGAVPYTGEVPPLGHPSSSEAFQRMFDELKYIRLAYKGQYVITTPVQLYGYHWELDGNYGSVYKRTTEKSGITSPLRVGNFYAPMDINCVFITRDNARYWNIRDIDVLCQDAPADDRPVCFYLPSVVNYNINRVNTRGGLYSFWFKSGWQGYIESVRTNEEVLDGFFYDSSRVDVSGTPITNVDQSATSVMFDKVYVNTPGRYGFNISEADYISFGNAACDGAGVHSYRFHQCQAEGNISSEKPRGGYVHCTGNGGVYDFYASWYDSGVDTGQYCVLVEAPCSMTIRLRGRTSLERRFNVAVEGAVVEVKWPKYWNGSTEGVGTNTCVAGSRLSIGLPRGSGAEYVWQDGKLQEVRDTCASYTARPSTLSVFNQNEARISTTTASTSLNIPMQRIKEIFPNFNGSNNDLVEWLQVTVRNGTGLVTGATFFCANNSVVASGLTQTQVGNGSAQAVITGITANSTNLTLTFTGSLGAGAVIILRPL